MNTQRALLFGLALARSVCLCAVEWTQEKEVRWRELPKIAGNSAGFTHLSAAGMGLTFTNVVSEMAIARNRVVENGAGVALGDYDGDGLPDIFACGIESPSRLYRNLGDWKFEDCTVAAGLPFDFVNVRGAVFADIDGDGFVDLLVSRVLGGVRCFLNSGGRFVEATEQCGLARPSGATTLALADVDGNGSVDLYVTNYRTNDIRDVGRLAVKRIGGKTVIPPELKSRFTIRHGDVVEYGEADQLYLNDGSGHFRPVSWTGGAFLDADGKPLAEAPLDWGLTATFRDVNGDGAPDLYVCNDYWTPDRFWINDGKGHFRAAPRFALRKAPFSSMGVDFADINGDGHLDFFCAEMLASDARVRKRQALAEKLLPPPVGVSGEVAAVFQNTLFMGRGDGTFAEAAWYAGVAATDWSWSPLFIDVDLDGHEDLLISAGHFHDVQDLEAGRQIQSRQHSWSGYTNEIARQETFTKELLENYRLYPSLNLPMRAFQNGGDLRFKDVTSAWGFTNAAIHHGMAVADLDGDGDSDIVVNCFNGSLEVYRNDAEMSRAAIRLKGSPPNTAAIGSKIVFRSGAGVQQKEIVCGGRYLSGSEPLAVFGCRSTASLEITWRSGAKSVVNGIVPNRLYEVVEPAGAPILVTKPPPLPAWFEDVSHRINHQHHETAFDDFERQPTLPFRLSQRGPACVWFDMNGDGYEDLIVGSALFYSDGRGIFSRGADLAAARGDCLGMVGWRGNSNALLAACSAYKAAQKCSVMNLGVGAIKMPANFCSCSALALGCFAPPHEMALFVGGDVQPARYPLATPSALLRMQNGEWKFDATNSAALASVGIVNGAVWTDLNGDGISELVLACEWGSLRVFANRNGALSEITGGCGLAEFSGLWRGIASADVNGDGQMDLIAANWGLNSPWRAEPEKPLTVCFGEFTQPGRIEFIEADGDGATHRPLERLTSAMPFLLERFATFKMLSEASVDHLLDAKSSVARHVSVKTLASTLFLNRGGKFEAIELPMEAQLAPAFSANAVDFDGDGNTDIFLSQNFIALHPDYPRQDAGRGLLLKGDGRGGFNALSGDQSGIKIYGEQRGAAVCDFDRDGRPDLAVTQNGAETKLYRNARGKPGVRIRLVGPKGNPLGIGAQVWTEQGGVKSAVQEIQAGAGYLAQDSAFKILAVENNAVVKVRWPGGMVTSANAEWPAAEVIIAAP